MAIKATMGALGASVKSAAGEIGTEGFKRIAKDAGKKAVKGGAMGAAGGYAMGTLKGDDPWNSAGRGAMAGAAFGGMRGGVRGVTGAQAGQSSLAAAMDYGEKTGISKQVTALGTLGKNRMASSKVASRMGRF